MIYSTVTLVVAGGRGTLVFIPSSRVMRRDGGVFREIRGVTKIDCTPRCTHTFGQDIHTLRQAFCGQSDGLARVEAVTSLLLSDGGLQTSAGVATTAAAEAMSAAAAPISPATITMAATATATAISEAVPNEFLATREAFCLDAPVSANMPNSSGGESSEVFFPGEYESGETRSVKDASSSSRHDDQRVDIDVVLREIEEKHTSRRQRLLGRLQQQQQQQQRFHHGQITASILDDECAEQAARARGNSHTGRPEDDDGRRQPSHQGRARKSSYPRHKAHEVEKKRAQQLALAASVSTLSGMLGTLDDEASSDCLSSVNSEKGEKQHLSGRVVAGKHQPFSERVGSDVGAMARDARRLGLPLLMVQSTEDALIGSPLALLLQHEVWHD